MTSFEVAPLRLQPRFVERVWGGHNLCPDSDIPIGELWAIGEENVVLTGQYKGKTLGQLAKEYPVDLIGQSANDGRFPLLIKLLDSVQWLSVQVHPDNIQAERLEGQEILGKTEAWHVLKAKSGAELIAGIDETITENQLRDDIMNGRVMQHVVRQEIEVGDSLLIPAGTVHAIGPDTLIYEVQQSSDITYRIYDWDRPLSEGRSLHLTQSAEVARPTVPKIQKLRGEESSRQLIHCDYFVLRYICPNKTMMIECDTEGKSFHAVTLIRGNAEIIYQGGGTLHLSTYDSLLIPASLGNYTLHGSFVALVSSLP